MKPLLTLALLILGVLNVSGAPSASFAEFDRKARAHEPLSVVFFGGSLTFGANASNPEITSWRGLMMTYLQKNTPARRSRSAMRRSAARAPSSACSVCSATCSPTSPTLSSTISR